MIEKLQAELLKVQDNLQTIEFTLGSETFKFYYRYLTLLEKVRIEQMCVKTVKTVNTDGTTEVKYEKQDHLIPIHTILEKALDEDGKRLFTHTNQNHFKLVSNFPAALSSGIAYQMSLDVFGNMKKEADNG